MEKTTTRKLSMQWSLCVYCMSIGLVKEIYVLVSKIARDFISLSFPTDLNVLLILLF